MTVIRHKEMTPEEATDLIREMQEYAGTSWMIGAPLTTRQLEIMSRQQKQRQQAEQRQSVQPQPDQQKPEG